MESQQAELLVGERERGEGVERGQEGPEGGKEGGGQDCEEGHLHQVEEAGDQRGGLGGEEAEQDEVVGVVEAEAGEAELEESCPASSLCPAQHVPSLESLSQQRRAPGLDRSGHLK